MHYSGFSWLAGFAFLVWALHRRLYLLAGIALVYSIVYTALAAQLSSEVQTALWLAQFILLGSFANRIHRMLLERRGWVLTEQERGAGEESA
jgi:hypothetical protein